MLKDIKMLFYNLYKVKKIDNLQSTLKTLFGDNIPSLVEDDIETCIPSQGKEHTVFFRGTYKHNL